MDKCGLVDLRELLIDVNRDEGLPPMPKQSLPDFLSVKSILRTAVDALEDALHFLLQGALQEVLEPCRTKS